MFGAEDFSNARRQAAIRLKSLAANEPDTGRQYALSRAVDALESPVGRGAMWAAHAVPEFVMGSASSVADYLTTPATKAGPLVARGFNRFVRTPELALPVLGLAAVAPTLYDEASSQYHRHMEEANQMVQHPGSVRIAQEVTLESFMSKTAAVRGQSLGENIGSGLGKGLGEQFGKGLIDRLFTSAGSTLDKILSTPARKDLIKRLFDSDPIISDALRRNPQMQKQLLEAYATMIKFAPSLTTDTNAVRSFLREVVLGGGNVNYAVIKNLIDTEKAYHR